jgi:hypothetical protein
MVVVCYRYSKHGRTECPFVVPCVDSHGASWLHEFSHCSGLSLVVR